MTPRVHETKTPYGDTCEIRADVIPNHRLGDSLAADIGLLHAIDARYKGYSRAGGETRLQMDGGGGRLVSSGCLIALDY